jgi:hypothetical protein
MDHVAVAERRQPFFGDGQHLAPQGVHQVAVDAPGAGHQAGRVDQVRRADVMDVDMRSLPGPPAGGTGVVEVDVGQQDMANIGRAIAVAGQRINDGRNCRAGTGLDQHRPFGADQQVHGRHLGHALEVGIKNVELHNPES